MHNTIPKNKNPYKTEEADFIECMRFFKNEQAKYDHSTNTWRPVLTNREKAYKMIWLNIINQRIKRVKESPMGVALYRQSAKGVETTY